jgi:hypothetical protein
MASTHEPHFPTIDLVLQAVIEALQQQTIEIANFPPVQPVIGAFFPATQPVSGGVAITNWPSLQNVAIVNFPAIQTVAGTIAIGPSPSTTAATWTPGYTTSASAPVTVPLTTVSTLVKSVFLLALKSTGAKNTTPVFVGLSGVAANQSIPLLPGAGVNHVAPDGKMLDLAQIYVRISTIGDGISWLGSK